MNTLAETAKFKIGKGWGDHAKILFTPVKVKDTEVLETTRYDIFLKDEKNRPIREEKVVFFLRQFKAGKFFMKEFPAVVDKNHTILDGQHRFEAVKRMELPFYFKYSDTLTIDNVVDVQINAGWHIDDYIHAFIKQENQNYIILHRFMKRYGLSASIASSLLGDVSRAKGLKKMGFYDGSFIVTSETDAHAKCKMLFDVAETVPLTGMMKNYAFVSSMVKIVTHPDYEHKRLISQLKKYPSLFQRQLTMNAAIRNLEEVYNYRLFTKNKIRFI